MKSDQKTKRRKVNEKVLDGGNRGRGNEKKILKIVLIHGGGHEKGTVYQSCLIVQSGVLAF